MKTHQFKALKDQYPYVDKDEVLTGVFIKEVHWGDYIIVVLTEPIGHNAESVFNDCTPNVQEWIKQQNPNSLFIGSVGPFGSFSRIEVGRGRPKKATTNPDE